MFQMEIFKKKHQDKPYSFEDTYCDKRQREEDHESNDITKKKIILQKSNQKYLNTVQVLYV